jgi:signal transduction histidine kinase
LLIMSGSFESGVARLRPPILRVGHVRVVRRVNDLASAGGVNLGSLGRTTRRRADLDCVILANDVGVLTADDDVRPGMGYRAVVNRLLGLWQRDRGRLAHHAIAGAVGIGIIAEVAFTGGEDRVWLIPLAVVAAGALALQPVASFTAPLVALAAMLTMVTVSPSETEETAFMFLALLLATWCLGANNDRRHALAGLIAAQAATVWLNYQFDGHAVDYFFVSLFVGATWLCGFVVNRRAEHTRALTERARLLESEQARAAERAVEEERARIARELHDVIAHSVSVMTVQAGAVRRLLQPEQERERQALETVEETGRQALAEMRRLVGLLREQDEVVDLAPQPGMKTLDILVGTVREAGLPVDLAVEGQPRELAPGVDLSAYRVVQEALTNTLKYAGPAQAWVNVRWGAKELELVIANDGRSDGGQNGGGHGLVGMRERVALCGGELESGPRAGGGYIVRARLPIGGAP